MISPADREIEAYLTTLKCCVFPLLEAAPSKFEINKLPSKSLIQQDTVILGSKTLKKLKEKLALLVKALNSDNLKDITIINSVNQYLLNFHIKTQLLFLAVTPNLVSVFGQIVYKQLIALNLCPLDHDDILDYSMKFIINSIKTIETERDILLHPFFNSDGYCIHYSKFTKSNSSLDMHLSDYQRVVFDVSYKHHSANVYRILEYHGPSYIYSQLSSHITLLTKNISPLKPSDFATREGYEAYKYYQITESKSLMKTLLLRFGPSIQGFNTAYSRVADSTLFYTILLEKCYNYDLLHRQDRKTQYNIFSKLSNQLLSEVGVQWHLTKLTRDLIKLKFLIQCFSAHQITIRELYKIYSTIQSSFKTTTIITIENEKSWTQMNLSLIQIIQHQVLECVQAADPNNPESPFLIDMIAFLQDLLEIHQNNNSTHLTLFKNELEEILDWKFNNIKSESSKPHNDNNDLVTSRLDTNLSSTTSNSSSHNTLRNTLNPKSFISFTKQITLEIYMYQNHFDYHIFDIHIASIATSYLMDRFSNSISEAFNNNSTENQNKKNNELEVKIDGDKTIYMRQIHNLLKVLLGQSHNFDNEKDEYTLEKWFTPIIEFWIHSIDIGWSEYVHNSIQHQIIDSQFQFPISSSSSDLLDYFESAFEFLLELDWNQDDSILFISRTFLKAIELYCQLIQKDFFSLIHSSQCKIPIDSKIYVHLNNIIECRSRISKMMNPIPNSNSYSPQQQQQQCITKPTELMNPFTQRNRQNPFTPQNKTESFDKYEIRINSADIRKFVSSKRVTRSPYSNIIITLTDHTGKKELSRTSSQPESRYLTWNETLMIEIPCSKSENEGYIRLKILSNSFGIGYTAAETKIFIKDPVYNDFFPHESILEFQDVGFFKIKIRYVGEVTEPIHFKQRIEYILGSYLEEMVDCYILSVHTTCQTLLEKWFKDISVEQSNELVDKLEPVLMYLDDILGEINQYLDPRINEYTVHSPDIKKSSDHPIICYEIWNTLLEIIKEITFTYLNSKEKDKHKLVLVSTALETMKSLFSAIDSFGVERGYPRLLLENGKYIEMRKVFDHEVEIH